MHGSPDRITVREGREEHRMMGLCRLLLFYVTCMFAHKKFKKTDINELSHLSPSKPASEGMMCDSVILCCDLPSAGIF